jgi:formylglycine-generating enzyme required for sulfatase activity
VRITRAFYLGQHEVTVGQFRRFVTATDYKTEAETDAQGGWGYSDITFREQKSEFNWRNTGWSQSERHPVVNVTWNDAIAFCDWLTQKEGKKYRLPTEAEWEYACRGGTSSRYSTGDAPGTMQDYANVQDASFERKLTKLDYKQNPSFKFDDGWVFTSPTGTFKSNGFGLCDMHGNVWEWCADWYDKGYYAKSPGSDPLGAASGSSRVHRGGCWYGESWDVQAAFRGGRSPFQRDNNLGFRVAAVPSGQ